MEEAPSFLAIQRVAVVTGANKGIGFEICKQLASKGVLVVLTARDSKKGNEALATLKPFGFYHNNNLIFHHLDVGDPSSIAKLVDFLKSRFGKLDILVNNAAILGVVFDDVDAIKHREPIVYQEKIREATQTYHLAEECINTNYYGMKRMIESLLPLLELSNSARIVNISSSSGKLKFVGNAWAIGVLSDHENLTEDRLDKVLDSFLIDFKDGLLETKGWPSFISAYTLSKAAMNAYTRMLAAKYKNLIINCVCPGHINTDMTCNTGSLMPEEGAKSPVWLALLPEEGPSGHFFHRHDVLQF